MALRIFLFVFGIVNIYCASLAAHFPTYNGFIGGCAAVAAICLIFALISWSYAKEEQAKPEKKDP